MKNKKNILESLAALMISLLVIMVIDRLTNRLDVVEGHIWDFVYYIDMAKNGIIGNDHLASPYAYRTLTPMLARFINQTFHFSVDVGFKIVTYLGVWGQLFGVYLLARHFNARFKTAIGVMMVPTLALFNVKFLVFDFYRPDPLAYPAMVFGYLAVLKKKNWLAVIITMIGLQTREFPIIPSLIILFECFRSWRRGASYWRMLLRAVIVTAAVGFAFLLPRMLVPVTFTQQILDPFNDPKFFRVLTHMPFNWKRDLNYVFNLFAYFMPLLILATPKRLRYAWDQLGDMQAWIIIHMAVVMVFMMYGGTDMMRYSTYYFIPQVLLLIFILRDLPVHLYELAWMYVALLLFNRILFLFPIWDFSAYLNFYAGYGDWINFSSLTRALELAAYFGVAMIIRFWIRDQAGRDSLPETSSFSRLSG